MPCVDFFTRDDQTQRTSISVLSKFPIETTDPQSLQPVGKDPVQGSNGISRDCVCTLWLLELTRIWCREINFFGWNGRNSIQQRYQVFNKVIKRAANYHWLINRRNIQSSEKDLLRSLCRSIQGFVGNNKFVQIRT